MHMYAYDAAASHGLHLWSNSASSNYFWPTGHFTRTWQLAGLFQRM